ncbi:MAG: A24 family peptidase [Proteobacteria bacterium]|nr:A24 family peptidase [Pseudomonadota bacterium]
MPIFQIILYVAAAACAVAISVSDFRHRIIPDAYLFPMLLIGLFLGATHVAPMYDGGLPWIAGGITESVIAAVIGYAMGGVINLAFKAYGIRHKKKSNKQTTIHDSRFTIHDDPIGMGDIKLLGVGGIWLGVTGLSVALVSACAIGIIWGMRRRQKFVPFAPFFFMGAVIAIAGTLFGIF